MTNPIAEAVEACILTWIEDFEIECGAHDHEPLVHGIVAALELQQVPSVKELTKLYLKTGMENRKLINEALAKKQAKAVYDLLTARLGVDNDR